MYHNKLIFVIFAVTVSSAAALDCLLGNLNDALIPYVSLDADVCVKYDFVCKPQCTLGPDNSIQTAYLYATNAQIAEFQNNADLSNFQYCSGDFCMAPPDTADYRSCYVTSITSAGLVLPQSKPVRFGPIVCVYYSETDGGGNKVETFTMDTPTNCEALKSTKQNVLCCESYFCNAPDKIVPGAPTVQSGPTSVATPTQQNTPAGSNTPAKTTPSGTAPSGKPTSSGAVVVPSMMIAGAVVLALF